MTDAQKLQAIREIFITYHAVIDTLMHPPTGDDVNTLSRAVEMVLDDGSYDRLWFMNQIQGDGKVHGS